MTWGMTNPTVSSDDSVIRKVAKGALPVAGQRRRLERLLEIDCENLVGLIGVEETQEAFVVRFQQIEGMDLTVLRSGRLGLTLGEAWRLLADLCTALIELHSRGIIHGDLSPGNVIIRNQPPAGRAVVIDVGGEEEWEIGTPGFQAPELVEGGHGEMASDVWSAARLALWAVADEHRIRLAEELRDVIQMPATDRPGARELQQRALARATPSIMLPDDARLAAAHLRARVASARTMAAPVRPRARRRSRLVAALTALAIAFGTFAVLDLWVRPRGATVVGGSEPNESEPRAVVESALELTQLRDDALVESDRELLARVTEPGSPAALADLELLDSFRGSRPEGLRTHLEVLRVVSEHVVEASIAQSEFVWRGGARDGVRVGRMPPRCIRLHLVGGDEHRVVQRVSACAAEEISG